MNQTMQRAATLPGRPVTIVAERDQLLRMRAGLIRAIREIDQLLGMHGTFAKDIGSG